MADKNQAENMDVLTVEEAATYLKFSTTYIYRLAKEKKIPHICYGRHILFRKSDLFAWLGTMVCYEPEILEA
jgi:excisionase family DNA binding protein